MYRTEHLSSYFSHSYIRYDVKINIMAARIDVDNISIC